MNDPHPEHEPSLLDVQLAFEHWRLERSSSRQPTPSHLRTLTVVMLEKHKPFTICKALSVNSSVLKKWAMDPLAFSSGGVERGQRSGTAPDHQW